MKEEEEKGKTKNKGTNRAKRKQEEHKGRVTDEVRIEPGNSERENIQFEGEKEEVKGEMVEERMRGHQQIRR